LQAVSLPAGMPKRKLIKRAVARRDMAEATKHLRKCAGEEVAAFIDSEPPA